MRTSGQWPSGLRLHLVHVCSPLLDQQRTVWTLPQVTDQSFDIHFDRAEDAKELPLTGEVDRMTIVKHDRGRARPSGRTARPESHWIRSMSQRRSFGPVIAVCSPRPRQGTPGPCSARCHPAGVSGRVGTSGLLIWNDLSIASDYLRVASDFWARHVSGDRAAPATVDHSDIRGSRPHGRHPSGAASD